MFDDIIIVRLKQLVDHFEFLYRAAQDEHAGFNSKFVITGDLSQRDLVGRRGGLADVEKILGRVDDVAFAHLERADVVRHALVGRIVEAYDAYDDVREQRSRDRKESR